jgi:integrase
MEIKDHPLIQDWLNTVSSSENTTRNYLITMKAFCEWTKKSPDELISEAEEESCKLMRLRNIKPYFINFRKHLLEENKAPLTVKGYMTGIKSFYRTNDIETPLLPRMRVATLEKNNEIPTKEDLQQVLKVCNVFERAIILVGASSGLAVNEIIKLKVKDFKKGYDPKTEVTTLKLRREKVQFDFVTFLTPEASRAVLDYLDHRNIRDNQHVRSDDNYLFINRNVPESFLKSKNDCERQLTREVFMKVYKAISIKSQKESPVNDWNLIRSHNMRKYFNSALLNAGADSFFTEYLMGHTIDSTRVAYFRASPENLKEIYLKFVPYLTIQKELVVSESAEFQRIKEENQTLKAEIARHIVERSELQELRTEIEQVKSMSYTVDPSTNIAWLNEPGGESINKKRKPLHKPNK